MYIANMPAHYCEQPCKVRRMEAMPPLATVLFTDPDLRTNHAQVEFSKMGGYDGGGHWYLQQGNSFEVQFDKGSNAIAYILQLDHEMIAGASITITVNGQNLVSALADGSQTTFDITEYLQTGENRVHISFDDEATGTYLIKGLVISPRDNHDFLIRH